MRRTLAALATALTTAAPLAAQDLATEYMAAARMFSLPGGPNDYEAQMAWAAGLVVDLRGRWSPAYILLDEVESPEGLARLAGMSANLANWCGQVVHEARVAGPHSFDLAVFTRGADSGHAVRYQYVSGRSFQRSIDEVAYLTRLGMLDGERALPPQIYASTAVAGIVEVFHPSDNVLVIQVLGGNAEIYVRCP